MHMPSPYSKNLTFAAGKKRANYLNPFRYSPRPTPRKDTGKTRQTQFDLVICIMLNWHATCIVFSWHESCTLQKACQKVGTVLAYHIKGGMKIAYRGALSSDLLRAVLSDAKGSRGLGIGYSEIRPTKGSQCL
jgi:hypothetical protein